MSDRVYDNVQQRRDAESVMDLIGERSQHFWECLASMCIGESPQAAPKDTPRERDPAMTEEEAIKFERVPWPMRGVSFGMEIGRVDPEWIARIVDGSDFDRKLRRYAKSERFKCRMREDEQGSRPAHVTRSE